MNKVEITKKMEETQLIGEKLAKSFKGGEIICLEGELGTGKTTFTQGLLRGLGAEGPYTSPTFLVMKEYEIKITKSKLQISNKAQNLKSKITNIYHIDAYRVREDDILNLGWEEIIMDPKNIIIVEWSERIKKILPKNTLKIKFEWLDEKQRKITFM